MARSDILISLVSTALRNDMVVFRRVVRGLIDEERKKKHPWLAQELVTLLQENTQADGTPLIRIGGKDVEGIFETVPEKKFEDLILDERSLKVCRDLIKEQDKAELLKSRNIAPRNRMLLIGSPGNGKTSLAEAVANHLKYRFLVIRYETLVDSYLGVTASRLHDVFEYIKAHKCVIFFDEFDAIAKERGDTKELGEMKRLVNTLLLQMDRLPSYVVVIAASNHPELLDRAVWRRFEVRLRLEKPGISQIVHFIKGFSEKFGLDFDHADCNLTAKLSGHSYSEIETFFLDVARTAILEDQDNIEDIITYKLAEWTARAGVNDPASFK